MNILEKDIKDLLTLLQTNQHIKDKAVAQTAWDKYLKLLRFTGLLDRPQQIFMDKTKRVLLVKIGNGFSRVIKHVWKMPSQFLWPFSKYG